MSGPTNAGRGMKKHDDYRRDAAARLTKAGISAAVATVDTGVLIGAIDADYIAALIPKADQLAAALCAVKSDRPTCHSDAVWAQVVAALDGWGRYEPLPPEAL